MRARWLICLLLVFAWAAAPAFADPPPTTQKAGAKDGAKKKSKKKARRGKKKSKNSRKKSKAKKGDRTAEQRKDADRPPPPRNLAIKGLRIVVEDATFEEMTFGDFTEWVARTTGANVVVRWRVLEPAGVERAFPIYIKQKNISVRKLLELAFSQVTHDLESIELAARADGNTIVISTRKDIHTKRVTRVYEVEHMLIVVPDFKGSGAGLVVVRQGRGRSGTGGVTRVHGGGSRGSADGDSDAEMDARKHDELIDFVTNTIQPESWKVNGGKGTIRYYKDKLVVYNNEEVHALLREFLPEAGE